MDRLQFNAENPAKSTASIHFEWSWNEKTNKWHQRRWGASNDDGDRGVPEEVLQAIPTTLLAALRDALKELSPGRLSRLGKILTVTANADQKGQIEKIFEAANKSLEDDPLVQEVEKKIDGALRLAAGSVMSQATSIRASDPKFDRIVNSLRVSTKLPVADDKPTVFQELEDNGLGYNNLIFIAAVLAELDNTKTAALPILLVEEPEAHLHPQLQILLARCLSDPLDEKLLRKKVQTIVTSHSPNIAVEAPLESIRVLHVSGGDLRSCIRLIPQDLLPKEKRKIRRMLDVTRASLLFARGVVLVEGITEAILLPVLADRLGWNLAERGISVVPICGVEFKTLSRLFGERGLQIPTVVITDSDPKVVYEDGKSEGPWRKAKPMEEPSGGFTRCDRVKELEEALKENSIVKIFSSSVTLEYDLALAGEKNAETMCKAWLSCYSVPQLSVLNDEDVTADKKIEDRALAVWRAICRSNSIITKGDFASALADALQEKKDGQYIVDLRHFVVPKYIENAFRYVWEKAHVSKS